jgi:hypothetical protein
MRYGQQSFISDVIGVFEGVLDAGKKEEEVNFFESLFLKAKEQFLSDAPQANTLDDIHNPLKHKSAVNTRDAKLHHLYAKTSTKGGHKVQLDLNTEVTRRMRVDHVFEDFANINVDDHGLQAAHFPLPRNFECLKTLMNTYSTYCTRMEDYDLKYVKYFVRECESLKAP